MNVILHITIPQSCVARFFASINHIPLLADGHGDFLVTGGQNQAFTHISIHGMPVLYSPISNNKEDQGSNPACQQALQRP